MDITTTPRYGSVEGYDVKKIITIFKQIKELDIDLDKSLPDKVTTNVLDSGTNVPLIDNSPIDLENTEIKERFSNYLRVWYMNNDMTVETLSIKSSLSVKALRRYLPGKQRILPQKIPEPTYYALLGSVGKTHQDFNAYCKKESTKLITIKADTDFHSLTPEERSDLLEKILSKAKCYGGCVIEAIDQGCIKYTIRVSQQDANKLLTTKEDFINDGITIHSDDPDPPLLNSKVDKMVSDIRVALSLNYSDIDIAILLDLNFMHTRKTIRSIITDGIDKIIDSVKSDFHENTGEYCTNSKSDSFVKEELSRFSIHDTILDRLYVTLSNKRRALSEVIPYLRGDIRNSLIICSDLACKYLYGVCISRFRDEYLKGKDHSEFDKKEAHPKTTRLLCLMYYSEKNYWMNNQDTLGVVDSTSSLYQNSEVQALSDWHNNNHSCMDLKLEYQNKLMDTCSLIMKLLNANINYLHDVMFQLNKKSSPDLSSPTGAEFFSTYLLYHTMKNGMTTESLSIRSGLGMKQIRRYLPGAQRLLPRVIPEVTFLALLAALGKTPRDFLSSLDSNRISDNMHIPTNVLKYPKK